MICSKCAKESDGVVFKYILPDKQKDLYLCPACLNHVFELVAKKMDAEIVDYLMGGTTNNVRSE